MAQNLPHLPDWEQVSTNIIRILGGNPSKVSLALVALVLVSREGKKRDVIFECHPAEN